MAQTITFDELAAGVQSSTALRTALDKLAASLSTVGSAGEGAQEVLQQLQSGLRATAAVTGKTVRSLVKFDEINRLTAPKTTAETSKTSSARSSGKTSGSKTKKEEAPTVWQQTLDALRGAWASFWEYLQRYYAPAIAAWRAAWEQIKTAALSIWEPVRAAAVSLWQGTLAPLGEYLATVFLPGVVNSFSQAFAPIVGGVVSTAVTALGGVFVWLCGVVDGLLNTVLLPGLGLLLTVWQDMMTGITAAWAAYGQPILDGLALGVQNLCTLLGTLWATVVQPVLAQFIALADQLWTEHLKPLWDNLVLALGSVLQLVLTVWNTALMPLLNWLAATLGPGVAQVFGAVGQAVAAAVGVVADCVNAALLLLGGLADFLTLTLQGQWNAAWQAMAQTVGAVWQNIVATVQNAVNAVVGVVRSMVQAISSAFSSLAALGRGVFNGLSAAAGNAAAALTGSRVRFQVPALASGAVIPPNREFLALLGDQRSGTNIEAPLDTIKQAFAETLAALGGGDGQPINIYIGEELLDSVVANSQSRRILRSGGR